MERKRETNNEKKKKINNQAGVHCTRALGTRHDYIEYRQLAVNVTRLAPARGD